ncbi:hypothetical protein BH23GEM9_BH23GEM9_08560 [soil metagenome]
MWKHIDSGAGIIALAVLLGAWSQVERGAVRGAAEASAPGALMSAQESGKAVFEGKGNCAVCHGREARGTPLGPDLTDEEWLNIAGTLDGITTAVRNGFPRPRKYPAPMPPMGGARLSAAEIRAVAQYVLELAPAAQACSLGGEYRLKRCTRDRRSLTS